MLWAVDNRGLCFCGEQGTIVVVGKNLGDIEACISLLDLGWGTDAWNGDQEEVNADAPPSAALAAVDAHVGGVGVGAGAAAVANDAHDDETGSQRAGADGGAAAAGAGGGSGDGDGDGTGGEPPDGGGVGVAADASRQDRARSGSSGSGSSAGRSGSQRDGGGGGDGAGGEGGDGGGVVVPVARSSTYPVMVPCLLKSPHTKITCTLPPGTGFRRLRLTVGAQDVTFDVAYKGEGFGWLLTTAFRPVCSRCGSPRLRT